MGWVRQVTKGYTLEVLQQVDECDVQSYLLPRVIKTNECVILWSEYQPQDLIRVLATRSQRVLPFIRDIRMPYIGAQSSHQGFIV